MSKRVKDLQSQELLSRYQDLDSACVVSMARMDAISANRLRGRLREQSVDLHVVRNALTARALSDRPLGPLAKNLSGPCALATGGSSVIDVAKELVRLADEFPSLELKQGIIEGDPALLPVADIAKMKSRVEMIGEVVMLALSPARRIAGCVTGPGGLVAGCVKAVADKADSGESAAA